MRQVPLTQHWSFSLVAVAHQAAYRSESFTSQGIWYSQGVPVGGGGTGM